MSNSISLLLGVINVFAPNDAITVTYYDDVTSYTVVVRNVMYCIFIFYFIDKNA